MRRLVALVALFYMSGCPGREPAATGPARRVVTLTPSSTEIVAAAGGLDRLVGVDRYSTHPPAVAALPRVGDFLSPSLEAILALRPDLVVLDRLQHETADQLAAAGIRTVSLDVHRIADVEAGLASVGDALGTRVQADRSIAALSAAVAATRARASGRARVRTLIIVDRQPDGLRGAVAAGPGSYLDELVALAGGDNVMAVTGVRYPRLTADRIVEAAPTVILDATHAGQLAAWQEVARVPAVAAGRVHALTGGAFEAPSPRVGEALATIERLLHP